MRGKVLSSLSLLQAGKVCLLLETWPEVELFGVGTDMSCLFLFTDFCVKIIGGYQVTPHSRPYMVLLKGENICAGALITRNWVLTAAHCTL